MSAWTRIFWISGARSPVPLIPLSTQDHRPRRLSFRYVEDLLAERAVTVTHKTIRHGAIASGNPRQATEQLPRPGDGRFCVESSRTRSEGTPESPRHRCVTLTRGGSRDTNDGRTLRGIGSAAGPRERAGCRCDVSRGRASPLAGAMPGLSSAGRSGALLHAHLSGDAPVGEGDEARGREPRDAPMGRRAGCRAVCD